MVLKSKKKIIKKPTKTKKFEETDIVTFQQK